MKISLVLATLGRDKDVVDFLQSLTCQTYKNFDLIIIDQNKDGKIDAIVEQFKDCLDVRHVKVDFVGNARARDYGIGLAQGRIIAFPDDDCAYEKDVLKQVVAEFTRRKNLSILVAGSYDFSSSRFSIGVNSRKAQYFSRFQMRLMASSSTWITTSVLAPNIPGARVLNFCIVYFVPAILPFIPRK